MLEDADPRWVFGLGQAAAECRAEQGGTVPLSVARVTDRNREEQVASPYALCSCMALMVTGALGQEGPR